MQYEVNNMKLNELANQNSKEVKCIDIYISRTNEWVIHPTTIIIKNTN